MGYGIGGTEMKKKRSLTKTIIRIYIATKIIHIISNKIEPLE